MDMVAYCRVSTTKDDQVNSLGAQELFFKNFAKTNGYNLVKIYTDKGITGTRMKDRDGLLQLLEDSKNESFEMVAIKDVSRLARNTLDFLKIIRQLGDNNKKVLFASYSLKGTEANEFTLTMLAAVAQDESKNISERIKFGKKVTAEKGRLPNQVYGYNKIIGDSYNYEHNEKEQIIIRDIFNMYVNDGLGTNRISQELNKRGEKTKRNCRWSQNAISRILENQIYIGKVINGKEQVKNFLTGERKKVPQEKWDIVDNPNLKIIDVDLFNKAQKRLEEQKNKYNITGKRTSNKYLFSTLIKCKHCGYSFRRLERMFKKTYIRWVCSGRNANGVDSCPNETQIDEQELIDVINEYFKNILSQKDIYMKEIKKQFRIIYESNNESILNEKELQKKLSVLQKDRQKEQDMFRVDIITLEELKQNLKPIELKIAEVKDQLDMIKEEVSITDRIEDILETTFRDIEKIVNVENMDNIMLKRVIDKIEVDKNKNINVILKMLGKLGKENTVHITDSST